MKGAVVSGRGLPQPRTMISCVSRSDGANDAGGNPACCTAPGGRRRGFGVVGARPTYRKAKHDRGQRWLGRGSVTGQSESVTPLPLVCMECGETLRWRGCVASYSDDGFSVECADCRHWTYLPYRPTRRDVVLWLRLWIAIFRRRWSCAAK